MVLNQANSIKSDTEEESDHNNPNPIEEIHNNRKSIKADKKLKNILIIVFVTILILIPITYAITSPTEKILPELMPQNNKLNPNQEFDPATDFTSFDVVTGETVSLSQFQGEIVLLNFVNYGCNQRTNEIVSKQLLVIKDLYEERKDFIPISVFCGCCPIETLRNFATENELVWPWILDSDYSIVNMYFDYVQEYGYPTLLFINQNQNIVDYSGYYNTSDLNSMLEEMI
jgi:hypothetical protein